MLFQDLPIRRKVTAVIMLTSITAMLFTAAAFMVYDYMTHRREMIHNLSISSSMIAESSSVMLAFPSLEEANTVLGRLRADEHIVAAALYNASGQLFARYPSDLPDQAFPSAPGKTGSEFVGQHLIYYQPVTEGEKWYGTLFVKSDLRALNDRLRLYGTVTLLVFITSILLALVLSNALQRGISSPILALADTAKIVSERRDYSVRAPKTGRDELGLLTEAFNHMLTRIEEQTVALREGEERLRLALEASRTGTWLWHVKTNNLTWDRPWDENTPGPLGLKGGVFVGSLETFLDLIQPEDRTTVQEAIQAALKQKTDLTSEFRVIWPDGSVHYLAVRGKCFYDETGSPLRMTGVTVDITERKQAEEIHSFLVAIVESTDDAVIGKSMEGKVVSWNPAAERVYGFSAAEILGKPITLILSPDRPHEEPEILEAIQKGQTCHYETVRIRKDRRPIEVSLTVSPIKNARGQIIGISSISRDITESRKAQLELERQAAVLREQAQMLDLANVMARDLDDHIILWNTGMQKMYGWTKKEALGKLAHQLLRTEFPQSQDDVRKELFEQGSWEGELILYGKGGQRLIVASQWVLHRDSAGRPAAILEINNNITERKYAEEQILHLNTELEQRVQDRTAQLTAANKELEAFTYSVAHDLRAPLRHIDAFTRILNEDYATSLPPEAQRYLENICKGSRNMSRLVDDLLNLARVGRQELRRQTTSLTALVGEVLTDLKRETVGRNIEWNVQPLPDVEGDAGLLKQVFANLLANAAKYTRPCEIAIVDIGSTEMNGDVTIFIRDNGVGFNMKYADKLFGVFQRLHRAEEFEGTGVGLATVERIIRRHGGKVWAESVVGKGATFYFTLPTKEFGTSSLAAESAHSTTS
jgi:PAS domain S-box-containing protein